MLEDRSYKLRIYYKSITDNYFPNIPQMLKLHLAPLN